MKTCIYLGHLNPVTNAHVEIIEDLLKESKVIVMPVRFVIKGKEVTSKSFPFNFKIRKKMLESIFNETITVSSNYTFNAPFVRYFPPLFSPISWKLRNSIRSKVSGEYFTYTGDKAEKKMLKMYKLKPRIGKRKNLSATSVKEKMYEMVKGKDTNWKKYVPEKIVEIIEDNWDIIESFSSKKDNTKRVLGMKFPKEGFWSK